MGRPINHKKIGGNTSAAGQQLVLSAWFEGEVGPESAFLVKQKASRSFILAAVADPSRFGVFKLGNTVVEGETAILEVLPFGKTEPNGFAIATVTLASGGATTEVDGNYDLTYASGAPANETDAEEDFPLITFRVESGAFVEVVEVVRGGRFLTTPVGSTYGFDAVALDISVNPTVTVNTATALTTQAVENARKLAQHRVTTFDDNTYKYKVGESANEDGEANVATA
jgi:hypothetical protein